MKIQNCFRRHRAVQLLIGLRQEKQAMEEKLARLEQEAFISMIRREQELEHKKRMKQLRERQLLQRRAQRRKRFIEAAYDGNVAELKSLVKEFEVGMVFFWFWSDVLPRKNLAFAFESGSRPKKTSPKPNPKPQKNKYQIQTQIQRNSNEIICR